jgi:hypothetical protein
LSISFFVSSIIGFLAEVGLLVCFFLGIALGAIEASDNSLLNLLLV